MKKRNTAILLLIAISFLFSFAACGKKPDSQVKNNSKIKETVTGEMVTAEPKTENSITRAAVESQTTNSETKNNSMIEEFVSDPPITAADTSVQFVVGAPVIDKQVFDKTNSKIIEALNAYYSAFTGQTDFCFFWEAEEPSLDTSIRNINQLKDFISPRNLKKFAVIDLDNDSIPEVALSSGEYEDILFIFKYYNRHVYVYELGIRSFGNLKIDGTFHWSSSGSLSGYGSILFQGITTETEEKVYSNTSEKIYHINGKNVTYTECQKASEYQDNKPNATWYNFSDINLKIFWDMNN